MGAFLTNRRVYSLPILAVLAWGGAEADASGFDAAHLAWTAQGDQLGSSFGAAVSTAGDVNGDGFPDIIIGAPNYNGAAGARCGKVFVYYGSAAGLPAEPSWSAEGEQAGEHFGAKVALAGDGNGDGFSDIVVSAPGYSVGPDPSQTNLGRIYVFLGSASGLQATPAFVDTGLPHADLTTGLGAFGLTFGDFNGDGIADLVVTQWSEAPGVANVYYGSPTGFSRSNMWQSQEPWLGRVVTVADVNQDGFDDLIVAIVDVTSETPPAALVFYGSPTGLSDPQHPALTLPEWSSPTRVGKFQKGGPDYILAAFGDPSHPPVHHNLYKASPEGPVLATQLGMIFENTNAIVALGDINGDGFPDAVDLGGEFTMYLGSAGGFDPLSSGMGPQPGEFIASAGDIFGDKRDDILVGNPPSDSVALYRGTSDWSFPSFADITVQQQSLQVIQGEGTVVDLIVTNNGPGPARARVVDLAPPVLPGGGWECVFARGLGTGCPATGSGDLESLVTLDERDNVHFQLRGGLPLGYPVVNTLTAVLPSWVQDVISPNTSQTLVYGGNASLLFGDGFESGNLSAWSSHSPSGVSVVPSNGLEGNFALQATALPGSPGLVQDKSPKGKTLYHARFLLDATGFSQAASTGECLGVIFSGHATSASPPRFQVSLERGANGGLDLLGSASTDPGTSPGIHPPTSITPGRHLIEISWKKASGPGTKDGFFALLLDGAVRTNIAKISNAQGGGIGFVDLGLSSGCPVLGPAPFVIEDAFESWTNPK